MTARRLKATPRTPLTWSQRVTMRMIAEAENLDTRGLGIPGGTIRSLRLRGLIEPRSFIGSEWTLTKAGHDAFNRGDCDEAEGEA